MCCLKLYEARLAIKRIRFLFVPRERIIFQYFLCLRVGFLSCSAHCLVFSPFNPSYLCREMTAFKFKIVCLEIAHLLRCYCLSQLHPLFLKLGKVSLPLYIFIRKVNFYVSLQYAHGIHNKVPQYIKPPNQVIRHPTDPTIELFFKRFGKINNLAEFAAKLIDRLETSIPMSEYLRKSPIQFPGLCNRIRDEINGEHCPQRGPHRPKRRQGTLDDPNAVTESLHARGNLPQAPPDVRGVDPEPDHQCVASVHEFLLFCSLSHFDFARPENLLKNTGFSSSAIWLQRMYWLTSTTGSERIASLDHPKRRAR